VEKMYSNSSKLIYSLSYKDTYKWIIERYPMNEEIFAFRIIIVLSICYGIYLFIRLLYNLNKVVNGKKDAAYHNRLSDNPDYQYRSSGSFEDCVIAMLEWWKATR
jgi:hypothetical protein